MRRGTARGLGARRGGQDGRNDDRRDPDDVPAPADIARNRLPGVKTIGRRGSTRRTLPPCLRGSSTGAGAMKHPVIENQLASARSGSASDYATGELSVKKRNVATVIFLRKAHPSDDPR